MDTGIQPENQTMCDNCNAKEQQLQKLCSTFYPDAQASVAAVAEQDPSPHISLSMASSAEGTASLPLGAADEDSGSPTTGAVERENTQNCQVMDSAS